MTLHGAAEFRNRLEAIAAAPEKVARRWAEENARLMRSRIPRVTGKTAESVQVGSVSNDHATVVGSQVVNFLAAGTKAHEEVAHGRAMKFQISGRTIFTKRVHHPPTMGNPAIRAASRDALDESGFADTVLGLWNGAA